MLATYTLRTAETADVPGARRVMLDTLYRDMRSGYVPRWHGDIIDVEGAYLTPARHTLLVATAPDGEVVATGGVRSHGPSAPDWLAARYPAGITAQLCRIYVDPAHRRRGLARAMVDRLLAFIAADGGYTAAYLHTDPISPGAEAFWTAQARLVHDERPTPHGPGTVHFELDIPLRG